MKKKLEPFVDALTGNNIPIEFINECIMDMEINVLNGTFS